MACALDLEVSRCVLNAGCFAQYNGIKKKPCCSEHSSRLWKMTSDTIARGVDPYERVEFVARVDWDIWPTTQSARKYMTVFQIQTLGTLPRLQLAS